MDRTPRGGNARKMKAAKKATGGKRVSTPYERPSVGRYASKQPATATLAKPTSSWTNTASRILTKGATYLFTSLFKRQAPAITASEYNVVIPPRAPPVLDEAPPPLELVAQPSNDVIQAAANPENVLGIGSHEKKDIEDVLLSKDLTREQCERYISLIQSKLDETKATGTVVNTADEHILENGNISPRMELGKPKVRDERIRAPWEVATFQKQAPQECVRAPWERNEVPSMPQIHKNGSRWTPLQMPVTGGRELLKQRAPTPDNKPVVPINRRKDYSLIPGFKTQGDLDLSCFRKEKKKVKFAPRLMSSIPKQSSQTAHKILDSLNKRKSPFQDTRDKRKSHLTLDVIVG